MDIQLDSKVSLPEFMTAQNLEDTSQAAKHLISLFSRRSQLPKGGKKTVEKLMDEMGQTLEKEKKAQTDQREKETDNEKEQDNTDLLEGEFEKQPSQNDPASPSQADVMPALECPSSPGMRD